MSNKLKDCPFCGGKMEPFGPAQHNHPRNECWLAAVKVVPEEYERWNARALAAPVASAAPSGFEDWARNEGLIQESNGIMSVNSMTDLARKAWQAAIAHQQAAPAAPSGELPPLPNLDEEWIMQRGLTYTQGQMQAYARAIIAATAPNKQLVEALQLAMPWIGKDLDPAEHEHILAKARAALASAGVEVAK